ncbi:hypothetical protein IQ07DRAFT_596036 [Pyrenochaeta sp. DS3sAY3a]|nr:hypothetical protein IQ07DRAFT_596036 [Pyrenochaeta sp. DS3sAY3a]
MVTNALPFIPWSKTTLSKARKSLESSDVVQEAAVDLFALGYYGHANKLIDSLYQHSHGLDFDVYNSSGTIKALYDAWDTTGTIPTYAANPDPDKIFRGRRLDEKYGKLWESIQNRWTNGLPKEMRDKAKEGNSDTEDFKSAMERMNKEPENSDPDKSLTVAAVVQVAMLTGNENAARDLVYKNVTDLYRHVQSEWGNSEAKEGSMRKWLRTRLGLHHSNEIWKILKDAQLGKSIGVDEAALEEYIDEGCQLIEQRFTQGPARPYRNKSISELLSIMEEANSWPGDIESFIQPPATPSQIAALEARLAKDPMPDVEEGGPMLPNKQLPDDYKSFLLTSNGFQQEPDDASNIFCSIDSVGDADVVWLHDMDFELLPYDFTSQSDVDNIALGDFTTFSIGAGGDEGHILLIPPTSVKPVVAKFEEAYARANEHDKRMYERAAMDMYGGIDKLRELEWLCLQFYHWAPEQDMWGSFREMLEAMVEQAVVKRGWREERRREKEEKERMRKGEEERKEKESEEGGKGEKRKRDEIREGSETLEEEGEEGEQKEENNTKGERKSQKTE